MEVSTSSFNTWYNCSRDSNTQQTLDVIPFCYLAKTGRGFFSHLETVFNKFKEIHDRLL